MLYSVEIGKNIVDLRHRNGFSQEQLALQSDISVSYLRAIEHGRANPSLDILETIAKTLGVQLPVLLLYSMKELEMQIMMHQLKEDVNAARQPIWR